MYMAGLKANTLTKRQKLIRNQAINYDGEAVSNAPVAKVTNKSAGLQATPATPDSTVPTTSVSPSNEG